MTDLLSTKNTLNITYNYDKTNQRTGYFTLDLRQDNKTYVPKQLNTDSVTYYKEGGFEIKTWSAKLVNGKIVLQATDFPDLRKAGTYVIRATVDGIIFPSQGKCTLSVNGDFSADTPVETQVIAGHDGSDGASVTNVNVDENGLMTVTLDNGKSFTSQIKMPEAVKGDRGEKGSDGLSAYQLAQQSGFKGSLEEWLQSLKGIDGLAGKDAPKITNASITGKTLTFKLSDNSSYSVELPLLKGDRGEAGLAGKDAPTITNATIDGNTLSFDMSDGTKHSVILPLLKGDRGEAGLAGKDAPTITNVTLSENTLTFDLSDGSTYSVVLPLLKGDKGDAGLAGKDAPKITNVTLSENTLTFDLSDGSTYSVVLPLLKGDRGEKGENGLSAYQIAQQAGFTGTETDWLNSLRGAKGDAGLPGKDAPKITGVTLNDDQTQIVFNMSDGTKLESSFKAPTAIPGKDGKDAPTITGVSYKDNQLVFTLSDGSSISTSLSALPNSKISNIFFDQSDKKLVFQFDDKTEFRTNILSDPNLPANANNLSDLYITSDDNRDPITLFPDTTSSIIQVPFTVNKVFPKSSPGSPVTTVKEKGSIDLTLNTYPLLSNVIQRKQLDEPDTIVGNNQITWLITHLISSPDQKTVFAAIEPLPYIDSNTNRVTQPVVNMLYSKWYSASTKELGTVSPMYFAPSVPNIGTVSETDYLPMLNTVDNSVFSSFDFYTFYTYNNTNYFVVHNNSTTISAYFSDGRMIELKPNQRITVDGYFKFSLLI